MTPLECAAAASCAGAAVTMADFNEALSKISKSVGAADVQKHLKWMEDFGAV